MTKEELKLRLDKALEVASHAAEYLLSHEALRNTISVKAVNDYVTIADKNSEALIEKELKAAFPSDSFYGEESGKHGEGDNLWIIDPIDGTVDFINSFPCYTVSIAFKDKDGIELGVVIVPRQNEVFYAMKGEGAFLNGKRITTNENAELKRALAILVPPHRIHSYLDSYMAKMRRLYEVVSDVRSIGSAALSLCYVASGRCDMYYEMGLRLYDIAAGALILEEAGGSIKYVNPDEDFLEIVASSEKNHSKYLEIICD